MVSPGGCESHSEKQRRGANQSKTCGGGAPEFEPSQGTIRFPRSDCSELATMLRPAQNGRDPTMFDFSTQIAPRGAAH
ncbi:hypothetical protein Rmf_04040 [Roseomonas fluvialis]|uniref:Uncharacterized protein n=1 Tax=Roseomonas fluvialis TaxID=1750527 RepID=A0ABN6NZB9_9PROT|nr:hypothetical protein Rmf_04040 [Roseomonas fluvialis]